MVTITLSPNVWKKFKSVSDKYHQSASRRVEQLMSEDIIANGGKK